MNIAIYGGSFDPPHIGHQKIGYEVINQDYIDKLIVVPTYLNPFKTDFHLSPEQRLDLVRVLFEDQDNIEISDFEVIKNSPVPTIDTVEYFIKYYSPNKIYIVIGADNLQKLNRWKEFDRLKNLVEFIVISREGYEAKNDIIRFKNITLDINISSTRLREKMDLEFIPQKIRKKVEKLWMKE